MGLGDGSYIQLMVVVLGHLAQVVVGAVVMRGAFILIRTRMMGRGASAALDHLIRAHRASIITGRDLCLAILNNSHNIARHLHVVVLR